MVTEAQTLDAPAAEVPVTSGHVSLYPLRLQLPPEWELTDQRVLELGSLNEEWLIETDCERGLLIMPPPGPESSDQSGRIYAQTLTWSDTHALGRAFESSAMFELPNGERRMPDAAWISDERLASIAGEERIIWRVCPDFIVEVRSATDDLDVLRAKMEMWMSQGARLGWLVDPREEMVWVYRSEGEIERIERPLALVAAEISDDLVIDLSRVWPSTVS